MALLTIPTSPEKGVPQTYTLNVTDLIALISDTYFQQQTNWSKVVVMYQSSVSNQLEGVIFSPDGVSTSLQSSATFSTVARDIFNVNYIYVVDKQNGRTIVYAASIPDVANYTIDFSDPLVNALFSGSLKESTYALSDNSHTSTMTYYFGGTTSYAYLENVLSSGKKYIEFKFGTSGGPMGNTQIIGHISTSDPTQFSSPPYSGYEGFQFYSNYDMGMGRFFLPNAGINVPSLGFSKDDTVMFAIDMDARKIWLGVNGNWGAGNDPSINLGGNSFSSLVGNLYLGYASPQGEAGNTAKIQLSPTYLPSGFSLI